MSHCDFTRLLSGRSTGFYAVKINLSQGAETFFGFVKFWLDVFLIERCFFFLWLLLLL